MRDILITIGAYAFTGLAIRCWFEVIKTWLK